MLVHPGPAQVSVPPAGLRIGVLRVVVRGIVFVERTCKIATGRRMEAGAWALWLPVFSRNQVVTRS